MRLPHYTAIKFIGERSSAAAMNSSTIPKKEKGSEANASNPSPKISSNQTTSPSTRRYA